MALQTSGAISLNDVAGEFGGSTPHSLSEYYGVATGVPGSGTISLSDFYGTANTYSIDYLVVAGEELEQALAGLVFPAVVVELVVSMMVQLQLLLVLLYP